MKKIHFGGILFLLLILFNCNDGSKTITVAGTQLWTATGIIIDVGTKLDILANGEVSPNGSVKSDPDGVPNRPDWQEKYCVMKSVNHESLIGKIGEGGAPFFVGKKATITSDGKGELFLGVNDTDIGNNSGAYYASIKIRNP